MKPLKIANFLITLLLVALSSCSVRSQTHPKIGLELIAEGFTSPIALISPDDGSHRLFLVDQTGLIWILFSGKRLAEPFLDLRQHVVKLNSFYDERGLLGLELHERSV